MAFEQVTMKLSPPVYQAVSEVKRELESGLQRQVTFSETLEELVRRYRDGTRLDGRPPLLKAHLSGTTERGQAR